MSVDPRGKPPPPLDTGPPTETDTAQLDLTKTPPVVVDVYRYYDPSYMTAPGWVDCSTVTPPVVPGCTYTAATGVWTYPSQTEDMVAAVRAAVATNNIYLQSSQSAGLQRTQIAALTQQWTRLILRRIGGI